MNIDLIKTQFFSKLIYLFKLSQLHFNHLGRDGKFLMQIG